MLKMMREIGISCGIRRETGRRRYSSYKGVVGETFENVLGRDFAAEGLWEKMGTDVTEFKQSWGKAHFAPGFDFGSREIVARSISRRPVMQSDMGWQYQHEAYCDALRGAGIVQSMSRKGNCMDNGAAEQLFGHVKGEFFRGRRFASFEEFKERLEEYIAHRNARRRQVRLRGLTPEEFRNQSPCAA